MVPPAPQPHRPDPHSPAPQPPPGHDNRPANHRNPLPLGQPSLARPPGPVDPQAALPPTKYAPSPEGAKELPRSFATWRLSKRPQVRSEIGDVSRAVFPGE